MVRKKKRIGKDIATKSNLQIDDSADQQETLMNCSISSDPDLKTRLHLFEFFIPIKIDKDCPDYKLADFCLVPKTTKNMPEHLETDTMYLYYGQSTSECLLYWEEASSQENPKASGMLFTSDVSFDVFQALQNKKQFVLIWKSSLLKSGIVTIDVHIYHSAVYALHHPSEVLRGGIRNDVKTVVQFFYRHDNIDYPDNPICDKKLIDIIYANIDNCYHKETPVYATGHRFLIPKLRAYQSQAVQWMLERELKIEAAFRQGNERFTMPDTSFETEDYFTKKYFHPLFAQLCLPNKEKLFFNKYGGYFVGNEQEARPLCWGGVLADEMGLGKTVEVLACILLNPKNKDNEADPNYVPVAHEPQDIRDPTDRGVSKAKKRPLKKEQFNFAKKSCGTDAFNTNFECICGSSYSEEDDDLIIKCEKCGLLQHFDCVLNNPEKASDSYLCPHCWVSELPVGSRATLIVSPASITYQWFNEIQKHIRNNVLKVLMYNGVQNDKFIEPPILADNDVVIVSYETLRKELNYVNVESNESRRNMRNPKKFAAIPTPLTKIEWWRVCLDEAQMVESAATKTSEMAMKLLARNRWCITGTPIQKSVEDLFGLMMFLGFDPYWQKIWWKELVLKPAANDDYKPLLKIVNQIMWRTTKESVLDQIGIPPQNSTVHYLEFSAVEKAFYDQHHLQCSNDFMTKVQNYDCLDAKLNSMNCDILHKLMLPFRKLRQACCHPQIVRGEFAFAANTMTMPELLDIMIRKARNVCEETHRQFVASLNGLAGIYIIQKQYSDAIKAYERVLESALSRSRFFRTDKLQQFHTVYNMAEILTFLRELDDESREVQEIHVDDFLRSRMTAQNINCLRSDASKLQEGYLSNHNISVETAFNNFVTAREKVIEFQTKFQNSVKSSWWVQTLSHLSGEEQRICDRIKDELCKNEIGHFTIAHRFTNAAGLDFVVQGALNSLQTQNESLVKTFHDLSLTPTQFDVNSAASCHLRPNQRKRVKCVYCKIDQELKNYEAMLFRFDKNKDSASNNQHETEEEFENRLNSQRRRGTWADSELEVVLKCILSFARPSRALNPAVHDGIAHMKWFDALKKEFKCMRSLWMKITDYASSIDETEMGKIRMCLGQPNDDSDKSENSNAYANANPTGNSTANRPANPQPNIIPANHVDATLRRFHLDVMQAERELTRKLGRMLYLQNLQVTNEHVSSISTELCPVCQVTIGNIWSVLSCGHSVCEVCISTFLTNYSVGFTRPGIHCPVCREFICHDEISHVRSSNDMFVKGSWSAKVTGIIDCLSKIAADDSTAKSLVFCSWTDFLYVLEESFAQNEIPFISLGQKKNFRANLTKFKTDPNITVLLLPFAAGANGLNITEASHVLLVDPLLEHAVVEQAIGRVHRIGQTKTTMVHHFVVRDTIEQRVYEILSSNLQSREVDYESSLAVSDIAALFNVQV